MFAANFFKRCSVLSKISFNNKHNPFFRSLKEKVDHYFSSQKIETTGNRQLYLKGIILTLVGIVTYIALVFYTPNVWISLLLCSIMGTNMALLGFNVMHEGGHQSFSKNKWINKFSAYSLNVLGGSSLYWKVKHNINHHTFTNVEGMDTDMEVKPFMRLHDNQDQLWFHRFQHYYWVFLYGFTYIVWIFVDDFQKYFTGNIAPGSEGKTLPRKEHIIFWTTKLLYVGVYLLVPMYMIGFVPTIVGFAVMTFVCGICISVVFQMAHIVEETNFPKPDSITNKIEKEWAIHQIETTANFETKNRTLSWLLGGLNFQVEHHLFPKISHVHYPAINVFVKQTCLEFNIPYLEAPTFFSAICSHVKHIKRLGVPL